MSNLDLLTTEDQQLLAKEFVQYEIIEKYIECAKLLMANGLPPTVLPIPESFNKEAIQSFNQTVVNFANQMAANVAQRNVQQSMNESTEVPEVVEGELVN